MRRHLAAIDPQVYTVHQRQDGTLARTFRRLRVCAQWEKRGKGKFGMQAEPLGGKKSVNRPVLRMGRAQVFLEQVEVLPQHTDVAVAHQAGQTK